MLYGCPSRRQPASRRHCHRLWDLGPDGGHQFVGRSVFKEKGAGTHGLSLRAPGHLGHQEDDLRLRLLLQYLPCSLQPVKDRHVDVHDDDVGAQASGLLYRLGAVFRLPHQLNPVFHPQDGVQILPQGDVVVNAKNADRFHSCHFMQSLKTWVLLYEKTGLGSRAVSSGSTVLDVKKTDLFDRSLVQFRGGVKPKVLRPWSD